MLLDSQRAAFEAQNTQVDTTLQLGLCQIHLFRSLGVDWASPSRAKIGAHPMERSRWLVLGAISTALLLIVIDMTVLYTALPALTLALQATQSEKLWIVNM